MRTRLVSLVLWGSLSALVLPAPARAAQVGGLVAPLGTLGFAVSGGLSYGERDVKGGPADEVSTRRMVARAQMGLADDLDVYVLLGLSDAQFGGGGFEGTLGESVGLGVRKGVLRYPESAIRVVLDLQGEYFRTRDGSKRIRHQGYHVSAYVVHEMGAAGRTGYVYPYGGLRISYTRYDGSGGVDDYRGEDTVGVFGGADYFVNPQVFFTGEVHIFDETSLYLGVGYRF